MNIKLWIACTFLFTGVIHASEAVIDVPSFVGKTKLETSKIIGEPTSCSPSKYGEKCLFDKAETEIVFIEDRADWITIEGIDDIPFTEDTIKSLGFSTHKPSFSNSFTMRWDSIDNLISVSIFKGGTNSDYAYIKAYTP